MSFKKWWKLTDPETEDVYIMEVNPHTDLGSFGIRKGVGYTAAGASFYEDVSGNMRHGDTLVFPTGRQEVPFSFEGYSYNSGSLFQLYVWVLKDYPVLITDDLDRVFEVFLTNIDASREPSRNRRKHSYTINGIVLREILD